MNVTEVELVAMRRALALAETVRGRTSPNPAVGAVILDPSGDLVGEGATQPSGGPHAEIVALAQAGERAVGATAVVTLEPCAHTGQTGPCVDALIDAGIARVVYALDDPNVVAAGGGTRLEVAGVKVEAGVLADDAAKGALRPWLHAMITGRPFVTWKVATTLDGRVAAADATSKWISSIVSRTDAQTIRGGVDAIMVGSGTVLADDPQLTARVGDGVLADHQPLRVVLDRRHRIPQRSRVLDNSSETLVLDTAVPRFALKALFDRGVRHLLLEGGPTLAGAFIEAHCVDEIIVYLAPKLLGSGPSGLGDAGIASIAGAVTLEIDEVERLGPDIKITARPVWPEHAVTNEEN
jgi:diaminohydroxyphosphoribosylaminopyrimidine deaminase/5-amino-6-(5-phosphoribosylamino)uracil reductase